LLAPRPTPKLEDHPSSAIRGCLFNLFTATFHIESRSSIRNLRTRHAVVTGTHIHDILLSTHPIIYTSYHLVQFLLHFSQPLAPTHINFIGYEICRHLCELYICLRIVRKVFLPSLSTPRHSSTPLLMTIINECNSRPRCNYKLPKSSCEISHTRSSGSGSMLLPSGEEEVELLMERLT
jgi:hypothetical protein